MKSKNIGIIGGMGPEATLDLFKKIIKSTPALIDQDHIRVIIDSNCKIPDRVKAIFEKAEDPAPELIATARNLENARADLLTIGCNAAHYYYDQIAKSVSIPVLNIMNETAAYAERRFPKMKTFGLLAGSSTVVLNLYPNAFERINKRIIVPDGKEQDRVYNAIYSVKAGNLSGSVKEELISVSQVLHERGAEAIILGCTEIPLVLTDGDSSFPFIDATQALAEAAVNMALNRNL